MLSRVLRIVAAVFSVTITAVLFAPGAQAMNVTSTGESGACSLRGAIQAVNTNDSGTPCGAVVAGGTTPINLPANTYTPFDGQLVVTAGANLSINGANPNSPLLTTIDATNASPRRVFEIMSGAQVTLSGLTVTGGRSSAGGAASTPFEAFPGDNGGGILNRGSLTLDHVVVTGNQTGDGGAGASGTNVVGTTRDGGGAGESGRGGGIYNADGASLAVISSKITNNFTGDGGNGGPGAMGVQGCCAGHFPNGTSGGNGGPPGSGGGIYNSNSGSVSITNSTISENATGRGGNGGSGGQGAGELDGVSGAGTGGDGGDGGNGGKQYRKDQGTFWDDARGGGGIYNLGTLNMSGSTISGNVTGAGGLGGPSGPGGAKILPVNSFRVSGRAGSGGGGGRGAGLLNGGTTATANLTNVTITDNLTGDGGTGGGGAGGADNTLGGGRGGYGGNGGGIWAQGAHGETVILTHTTVAKNFLGGAGLGGSSANGTLGPGARGEGAGLATGGRFDPGGAGVYLRKTLIAVNGLTGLGDLNCAQSYPPEQYNDIVDQGSNLTFPGGSCPGTIGDPDLGLLQNNGGETQTMAPTAGSPAIGGVPLASCDITTDQRGFPRPGADGASCDIGAVETGSAPVITPTTIQVVSSANPSTPGQQVTLTATVSPPPSSGTVSFSDNGSTISGCGAAALQPGGQFTCQANFASAGTHSIVAAYTGNSLFSPSTSLAYSQTVGTTTPPDTTPPDTIIDSGPSGTIKTADATFAFHGTPGDTAKIQCKLDSAAYSDCSSPKTFSALSNGAHTVSFRAQDAVGNQDASPAVGSFTVDTSTKPPPVPAKIGKLSVSGPGKVKKGEQATFAVSIKNTGGDPAGGVKLKVRGGADPVTKSVGGIAGGQTKTPRVTVTLNKLGRIRLTFKVTSANAGGKTRAKKVTVKR